VLEGQINEADIATSSRKIIRNYSGDKYKFTSLDTPAYRDSKVSLIETIRSDQALWES
jgi:hypothetical protein